MNGVVASYSGKALHVILGNLNIHKPKHDRWLAQYRGASASGFDARQK
jgi:hypothetical protein